MKKSDISPMPQFFEVYIHLCDDIELIDGLKSTLTIFDSLKSELEAKKDFAYAQNKWTVKDVIQHINDNERIQAYRALRISRNDKTILPGYDENLLAQNTCLKNATIEDLINEYKCLRQSNIILFSNMSNEMLQRQGTCYSVEISALALGFVLVGHVIHHVNVLKNKYLNL